jgi:hypothetical protein
MAGEVPAGLVRHCKFSQGYWEMIIVDVPCMVKERCGMKGIL